MTIDQIDRNRSPEISGFDESVAIRTLREREDYFTSLLRADELRSQLRKETGFAEAVNCDNPLKFTIDLRWRYDHFLWAIFGGKKPEKPPQKPEHTHEQKFMAKFWTRVDQKGPDECWRWTGSRNPAGYGRVSFNGKPEYTHRIAYYLSTGKFPKLHVLHSCSNPICVNPKHLKEGTPKDNAWDRDVRGRHGRYEPVLDDNDVRYIRRWLAEGESVYSLAQEFGVSSNIVYQIKAGSTYKRVS